MSIDAGEGQRIRHMFQGFALIVGGFVGSAAMQDAHAKIDFLPDAIQWICKLTDEGLQCWDSGHWGDARLVDQCGDDRPIDAEGGGEGVLVLRDPSHLETHVVLVYSGRALVPNAGPDGRDAFVLWAVADRGLLRDGFEACRQFIR